MSLSPAERFAAAKQRQADNSSLIGSFKQLLPFELDPFQIQACRAIDEGHGVLVAAPTSAGKTIVGEFAVHVALSQGTKCFYTTPIKALSNQKYAELAARYGDDKVGLLTGDNSINGEASIVVMTTEVLRNMIYEESRTLESLTHVVMDEVHYLADRSRGAVWEEVIIHLPRHTKIIALSATVSNAEEFGKWLRTVRGDTQVIVEEIRPVPLNQHVMIAGDLKPLFVDGEKKTINPELVRLSHNDRQMNRYGKSGGQKGRSRGYSQYTPSRVELIEALEANDLLPTINFVFSRAGCDAAVSQVAASGISLVTSQERLEIRGIVDAVCEDLPSDDLRVLGVELWRDTLERGIAAHHAGMLPAFKEVVERLFQQGLIKVVFATETLALGINMPARSVVLEKLTKWNGETHAEITPGEYTQLTGRAGRRGIDYQGHAIVLWHQGLDPQSLAGLASARTYPLRSSFSPSYNMSINLIDRVGAHKARELLETSFAQFQTDQSVVGLSSQVRRNEETMHDYEKNYECHLGNFTTYMDLRRQLSEVEKSIARDGVKARRDNGLDFLNSLVRGDVVSMGQGRRSQEVMVVLDAARDIWDPRPRVMTIARQVKRVGVSDVGDFAQRLGRVTMPNYFDSRSPKSRDWLVKQMNNFGASLAKSQSKDHDHSEDAQISALRKAIRAHPCHGCDEREAHARWYERYNSLTRENRTLETRVERRTNSISAQFDRICSVLAHLGYLERIDDDYRVTDDGRMLSRIYGEMDLLTAQCLKNNVWAELEPHDLAAAASALVFEARRDEGDGPVLPQGALGEAMQLLVTYWGELKDVESQHRVNYLREPDFGFTWQTSRWAKGQTLTRTLRNSDLQPGDFVRWSKQVIDLLGQIAIAANDPVIKDRARSAANAMDRGIVSW